MNVVGITHHGMDGTASLLGHEYLLTDSNQLVPFGEQIGHNANSSSGSLGPILHGPSSTLVGSRAGLEIDLFWDPSVRSSASWASIEASVIDAAAIYTAAFSNHIVLNIAVGFGEVAGSPLSPTDVGESASVAYATDYPTITSALSIADGSLASFGLMSPDALTANSPPTDALFVFTSAEGKALGFISGSSPKIDGYIGISNSPSLVYFPGHGGTIGANQYDAVGVAAHEIGEVMGRIGLEAGSFYSVLDLFRYEAPGIRDLTPSAGYFSTTDGSGGPTNLNTYNDPLNGGDAADWASASAGSANAVINDAYDAFGTPGVITHLSPTDILEEASLGYTLSPIGLALVELNISVPA